MEEDKSNTTFQQSEEEDEDTFSLRDLPIHDHGDDDHQDQTTTPRASTDQDLFEFLGDLSSQINHSDNDDNNNIVFCGKVIPYDEDQLNEYQKRDYLSVRSSSFHKSHTHDHSYDQLSNESDRFVRKNRSKSLRFPSSEAFQNRSSSVAKCEPSPIRTVNITAITSMSTKSKCRMFMFAPVKFKPEMEMSAIKKRQSRRAPAPMFPAAVDGGEVVSGGRKSHHHWGLARQLRSGAHLANLLARSFGCVSASMV
ncbi:uncharacterized protein LOC132314308 [Cornus florida]|uniref:uncharacterized protein LOC132314308 n=1 Tax=Cornus florida TaxID=4283 RepID=UPI0028968841|nr:uncharacterized protein LOC132314308 [Cornus florida]